VQLSFTFYLVGLGFMSLVYGPISDRIGRRPVILTGLILFIVGSIVSAFAPNILTLNMARLLQGIGGAAVFVTSNAIFSDSFEGRSLAVRVTYGSLVWSLVPIIAPALGGFLQSAFDWRASFFVMAGYTIVVCLLLLFCLPETLDKNKAHPPSIKNLTMNYWHMMTHSRFLSFISCVTFSYGGVIVFNLVGPFILQDSLHVTPYIYGLYVLLVGLIYSVSIYLNTVFLKFFSGMQMIVAGVVITLLAGLSLLVFYFIGWFSVLSVLIGIGLIQVGQGFIFANCLAGSLAASLNLAAL
jgi:multidrug resistance protein